MADELLDLSADIIGAQRMLSRAAPCFDSLRSTGQQTARSKVNNKIKVIVKMAYGFRNLDNLFSMVMLKCSGLEVPLPCRA